jgi:hypothetical protein
MRIVKRGLGVWCCLGFLAVMLAAQGGKGALDLSARITSTGGRPEPVRQLTFYVLTKSYEDIVVEVEGEEKLPSRTEFINSMKVSPELKEWLKTHDAMDLTTPDLDKLVTPDDIIHVPEFLAAYQKSNSGGVTSGLPTPKFRDTDHEANPEKYNKQMQEYLAAMKKFIQDHPMTVSGMELELAAVNPKLKWDKLQVDHKKKIGQVAPDLAQTKYLAGKADTDLEGRAFVVGLAPGTYWVSSLGLDAASGDRHLRWDVPVKIQAGPPTRLDLTNVNGTDANTPLP